MTSFHLADVTFMLLLNLLRVRTLFTFRKIFGAVTDLLWVVLSSQTMSVSRFSLKLHNFLLATLLLSVTSLFLALRVTLKEDDESRLRMPPTSDEQFQFSNTIRRKDEKVGGYSSEN